MLFRLALISVWIAIASGCGERTAAPRQNEPVARGADLIYLGGQVITMDAAHPLVEAVAIREGRILAVGDATTLEATQQGDNTLLVNLEGKTLLPGFIDGHSHCVAGSRMIDWAVLASPPVGQVHNIAALLRTLHEHAERKQIAPGEWVIGWGYDPDGLEERRHVTRDDLDADFPDNPVMLLHVSGHGLVLNSAGFRRAGINADTPTPEGGLIVRKPGSTEPAGLLMETAAFPVFAQIPQPDTAQQLEMFERMQREYARNGYTTIQDGATDMASVALLRRAAAEKRLLLDVVSLPNGMDPRNLEQLMQLPYGSHQGRLKFGGVKLYDDGSPQGKTAYFTHPYLTGGFKGEPDWRGEPMLPEDAYDKLFAQLHGAGIQVWTHANGDAAVDMVIHAHELAGARIEDDRRDVVIHSQFVRPDQLDAYAKFGIAASFFTNHAFYWGDVHVRNLGEERAFFLSPLKAAAERGLHFSNHTDFFVTPLDPMMMLWTAVTRQSRSGAVIGADQRVDVTTALKALTLDAAWMYHEEADKGSIEPGKRADFVLLDRNPLEVEADELRNLRVMATIKDGELVYGSL